DDMNLVCILLHSITLFFSSRRRHTRFSRDWSSDVCSSDLEKILEINYVVLITAVEDGVQIRVVDKDRAGLERAEAIRLLKSVRADRKSVVQGKRVGVRECRATKRPCVERVCRDMIRTMTMH